jgi:hypothetical protein
MSNKNKNASTGVRVSLATIIAISSRLKESSDGFDYVFVLNDWLMTNCFFNAGNMRSVMLFVVLFH